MFRIHEVSRSWKYSKSEPENDPETIKIQFFRLRVW
ncbi:MAG TPA: hypothetical protein DEB17_10275 [Chlorobaculum sp.]|uniref:Uncharacterized protein n=1 Tax=Chlorobaculum tepidum (strain ATCC 49652 / DSM 12025 / NBRC 103806 / TLS) TaxID=194439 RepID=Q8KG72_CHLTE|nr:hypothetical protein CT0096 [Chlorobaculum tepidum TLS]HBU24354.1 hypothetical protein [Chlorobaculum sp.]